MMFLAWPFPKQWWFSRGDRHCTYLCGIQPTRFNDWKRQGRICHEGAASNALNSSFAPSFPRRSLNSQDRVLVRHGGRDIKSKEALEAETVEDLELRLLLAEAVVFLEHDDLEHEDRIVGRPTALALVRIVHPLLQDRAEQLPVHGFVELAECGCALLGFIHPLLMVKGSCIMAVLFVFHKTRLIFSYLKYRRPARFLDAPWRYVPF